MSMEDERRVTQLVSELIRLSERRYEPCFSDFLSESEQLLAQRALASFGQTDFLFWGGYESAERMMLCVYPEYARPEREDFPMQAVGLSFRRSAQLSHRDFLGALMALGIKREAVGDIVIGGGAATFFIKKELAPYVTSQLEKVGREGVKLDEKGADLGAVTREFEERTCTVSSMRLDAIVGACTNLSRQKAQQTIKSGLASVNAQMICDSDHRVKDGDKLSVRGYGKYIITSDGSVSKKGKLRLTILKYK